MVCKVDYQRGERERRREKAGVGAKKERKSSGDLKGFPLSLQLCTDQHTFEEITCSQGEKHLQGAITGIHTGLEIVHIPSSPNGKIF